MKTLKEAAVEGFKQGFRQGCKFSLFFLCLLVVSGSAHGIVFSSCFPTDPLYNWALYPIHIFNGIMYMKYSLNLLET